MNLTEKEVKRGFNLKREFKCIKLQLDTCKSRTDKMRTYERVSQHILRSHRDVLRRQKDQEYNIRGEQIMETLKFYCLMLNAQPIGSEKLK